jgi:hypothetical protein
MSGPKVVRVRTREELATECHTLIDTLRAEIEHCEVFARAHDFIDSAASQRRSALVQELIRRVDAGDFEAVRRACQAEAASIRAERQHIEDEVFRVAADSASRRRRCQYMAASLAKRLQLANRAIPAEIEAARLGQIGESDEELGSVESVVSHVLAELTHEAAKTEEKGLTKELRQLAAILSGADPGSGKPTVVGARFTSSSKRLDRAMGEVRTLDKGEIGSQLFTRMHAIANEPDSPQTAMRIDSMILEWVNRRKALGEIADKRVRATQLAYGLSHHSDGQAHGLAARLAQATDDDLDVAIAAASRYLDQKSLEAAAILRREAVLKGLAALGYEIGSELSTMWAKHNRAIVGKPDQSSYGIELTGPADASQMQVRVVAFAAPGLGRDAAQDRDAETKWCGEFARFQKLLDQEGTSVSVLHARGVGTAPVTHVEDPRQAPNQHSDRNSQRRPVP